jgi:hypothetical protein
MDFVILSGDQAIFDPPFPPAIAVPMPGVISGTAQAKNRVTACVEGDEASVVVAGAAYTSGAFSIPGVATLTIESLGADQVARQANSGGKGLILKGAKFRAKLQVTVPASNPSSGAPDPVPIYYGTGSFVTTNVALKAS